MNVKLINIQCLIITLFFVSAFSNRLAGCDMVAAIAKDNYTLDFNNQSSNFVEPFDYLKFIQDRSSVDHDRDGYGILYYKSAEGFYYNPSEPEDPDNQAWYQKGLNTYYTHAPIEYANDWTWEMNEAVSVLKSENSKPKIVLAHARKGTGGEGNHPFRFVWKARTYSLMHNGSLSGIKQALFNHTFARSEWRQEYPSNWAPVNSENLADYIDTEVFFHWLMKNIIESNGSVLIGLQKSLTTRISGLDSSEGSNIHSYLNRNILNFIFSDGEALYLFRGAAQNGNSYNLSYKKNSTFWSVKTQDNESGENLRQYELVCLSADSEPLRIPDFSNPAEIVKVFEHRNYPNPFNSETNIEFQLQKSSIVNLIVYNNSGQEVNQHNLGLLSPGLHTFKWNINLNNGTNLTSGIYYYRIKTDYETVTARMMLLK